MTMKKVIAAMLALLMILGLLAGCGNKNETAYLIIDGSKVKVDTILTIGDTDFSLALYRYFYLSTKASADDGDDTYWETYPEQVDYIKMAADNYCKNFAAIHYLCDKYNLGLTDEQQAEVEEQINSAIEQAGSYSSFVTALESNYLTEDMYRSLIEVELLSDNLQSYYFDEGGEFYLDAAGLLDYLSDDYILSRHILIATSDEDYDNKIEEVRAAIEAGEDFQTLAEEYSADTTSTTYYPDGQCYTEGDMITDFYEAAKATEVGEIGEVTTEEYGYFFIQRLELTEEYVTNNYDTLYSEYYNDKMSEVVSEYIDSVTIEYNDNYDLISIETLK